MNFMFEWQDLYSLVRYCFCHKNIKFISWSYCVCNTNVFILMRAFWRFSEDFRLLSEDFRRFSKTCPKVTRQLTRTLPNIFRKYPKISKDFRRLEEDPKMFRSYTNKLKNNLRYKLYSSEIIDIRSSEDMKNTPLESRM